MYNSLINYLGRNSRDVVMKFADGRIWEVLSRQRRNWMTSRTAVIE